MRDRIDAIRTALRDPGSGSSDFDLNPDYAPPQGRRLRPAAVLVALTPRAGGLNLILTKRASGLKHHPGQIAFPGGKVDAADATPIYAAIREADEEIGLPRNLVRPLGTIAPHETVTSFSVLPVIAEVTGEFKARPEEREVAEVFEVPLAAVTDPARFCVQYRMWQGQRRNYYTIPHGPYYIWGATARILRALADRLHA